MIDKRLHESAIKIQFKSKKTKLTILVLAICSPAPTGSKLRRTHLPSVPYYGSRTKSFLQNWFFPAARLLNLRRTWSSVKSTHGIVHFPNSLKIMPNLFTDVTFSRTTKTVRHHLVQQMYSRKQNCLQVKKHFFAWNKFNNYFSSYDEKYDGQALKFTWENLSEEILDICFYVVFKWNFEASWTADD